MKTFKRYLGESNLPSGETPDGVWVMQQNPTPHEVPGRPDGEYEANVIVRLTNGKKVIAIVWGEYYGTIFTVLYSEIFDEGMRGKGVYQRLLAAMQEHMTIESDVHYNNAAKATYVRLGARETRDGRYILHKK